MSSILIRGYRIGAGRPKVIIPLVEHTEADILAKAAEFAPLRADCVEWRADYFDTVLDSAAVCRCLQGLRAALGQKLLLVTLRTKAEGGELPLTLAQYTAFCEAVCASGCGCADLLDIELFPAGDALPGLVQKAHAAGIRVVCSSHDFAKTPPREQMVSRMVQMQAAGADIAKLAVMPQDRADVMELLAATGDMAGHHPETPVVTMSMGALGAVSRVCGETSGSAMTFASAGKASAPGQLGLDEMNCILDALHVPPAVKYLDAEEFDCIGVIASDSNVELVRAGAVACAMPVSAKNAEYERFARELDIRFFFEDDVPTPDFYTVPYVCLWATDSAGGFFGTVGDLPDLEDLAAPVCYISREKKCYKVADTFKAFCENAEGWRSRLSEWNAIRLYPTKADAQAANDFLPRCAVPCEAKDDGPTAVCVTI